MTIKTGQVTTYNDMETGQPLQVVPWQILDNSGVSVSTGNQSFPLATSVDEITAFLKQTLQVFKDDTVRYAEAKELQTALDTASETAANLSNIVIND